MTHFRADVNGKLRPETVVEAQRAGRVVRELLRHDLPDGRVVIVSDGNLGHDVHRPIVGCDLSAGVYAPGVWGSDDQREALHVVTAASVTLLLAALDVVLAA